MLALGVDAARADWVKSTYITDDTELLAAKLDERAIAATVDYAKQATRFDGLLLDPVTARKMKLLKLSLTLATPSDPKESEELTRIAAGMEGTVRQGQVLPARAGKLQGPGRSQQNRGRKPRPGPTARRLDRLARHRPAHARRILSATWSWPTRARASSALRITAPCGGRNTIWHPDDFARELDRLWAQVRPLYLSLHAYVRARLRQKYGDLVPASGPIPADLLGDMWAQEWDNIYPVVAARQRRPWLRPHRTAASSRNTDWKQMVKYGENFFVSLGFDPLPQTFWERSLFLKPRDRDVVCHASAWDVDQVNDVRLKMCIQITGEDFLTIHHELGHNFYQRAYNRQAPSFRDSANDGFHEAVGDTIALSITPEYLVKLGLLDRAPDTSKDIGLLLHRALEKDCLPALRPGDRPVALEGFLGRNPARKNTTRRGGSCARNTRASRRRPAAAEADFDPGAKYHVAANVPYMRYFLADILQFQFHRALAQAAGCTGPLNRCSIYGNKAAGARLKSMLEMGQSHPWQEALEKIAGTREMDASAIRDYFAPLQHWLDEQNHGKPVGW